MASLQIQDIPDDLLQSIQRRAAERSISIEKQVVLDLELAEREQADDDQLLADIRRDRESMAAKGVFLTDELIKEGKSWGRK